MQKHPGSDGAPSRTPSRPFLKWSGGKQRLLPQLLPLLPKGARLIEPFVGAGSVFLSSDYPSFVLADANPDLMAVWSALQQRPDEFMARASAFFIPANHSMDAYLRKRSEFNALKDAFERAVLLPYLNRFGFNGLFRVNKRGDYNAPYGWPCNLPNFPSAQMTAAAAKLSCSLLLRGGFAAAIDLGVEGDVVYCDPPYLDSTKGKSFTSYTHAGFSPADHRMLVERAVAAGRRGAKVVISNHDTPEARDLYRGWRIEAVSVRRSVSASASARVVAREIVAVLPTEMARMRGRT